MSLLWVFIIVLLVLWAGGYWGYPATRGNNALHLLLAIVLLLVLFGFFGHGSPHWRL